MEINHKEMIMNKLSRIILTSIILALSSLSFYGQAIEKETNPTTSEVSNRIDINHADAKTLSSLKGVGVKKAEAIIKYRAKYGKFTSVNDLLNVNGIGKKILAINKDKFII
jgi:competence protein ComEA